MAIDAVVGQLARNWGWIVLRGAAAILFGILSFLWPGISLAALVLLFGAYALVDGVLALIAAFKIRFGGKPMWPLAIVGAFGIAAAGICTFMWPGITALVLLSFIAAWALITGLLQIIAAIRLRKVIENEWMFVLSGALSVAFGLLMLIRPGAGAIAVIWIIAFYATLYGVFLLLLGLRMKGLVRGGVVPKPA